MLIVNRYPGNYIVINDNIKVYIRSITGSSVSLGIDAPNDVEITWPGKQEKGKVEEDGSIQ